MSEYADFGERLVDKIAQRQKARRLAVTEAHRRQTVWCCASDAEECFDDLDTLLRAMGILEAKP